MQGVLVMLIVGAALAYALRALLPGFWRRARAAPASAGQGLPALACQGCPVGEQCSRQRSATRSGDCR